MGAEKQTVWSMSATRFIRLFEGLYEIPQAQWYAASSYEDYNLNRADESVYYLGDDLDAVKWYEDQNGEPFYIFGLAFKGKTLTQNRLPRACELAGIQCPSNPEDYYLVVENTKLLSLVQGAPYFYQAIHFFDDHSTDRNNEPVFHETLAVLSTGRKGLQIVSRTKVRYNSEGGYDLMGEHEVIE